MDVPHWAKIAKASPPPWTASPEWESQNQDTNRTLTESGSKWTALDGHHATAKRLGSSTCSSFENGIIGAAAHAERILVGLKVTQNPSLGIRTSVSLRSLGPSLDTAETIRSDTSGRAVRPFQVSEIHYDLAITVTCKPNSVNVVNPRLCHVCCT